MRLEGFGWQDARVEARRNVVAVVTPDGEVHRFEADTPDACESFGPPDFADVVFNPIDDGKVT